MIGMIRFLRMGKSSWKRFVRSKFPRLTTAAGRTIFTSLAKWMDYAA
ncbi:hypothetical protein [Paenibacillus sp. ALJ109b]|nr:hypothetical protein [Paenibacillus sp. ALJ109b]